MRSFEDFTAYRDATFRITEAAGYELKLSELVDHSNAKLEQFSLVFTCPVLPWLPQGTYTLVREDRVELVLFLVPIGPAGGAMRYESVFSRFVNGDGSAM